VAAVAARPLCIALLTSSRFWRGSSSVFAVLARGLAARGHTTTALAAYEAVAAGFRARGLAVRTLPVGHTNLRAARALRRALGEGKGELAADVVLVDRPRDIRHAAFASLGRPLAVVYCISTPRPPRDLLTRLAFRRVRLTVFLTEQLAERALTEAPFMRRAARRVIPNGVDCELFRPDEAAGWAFRQRHELGDGPLLVAVGALEIEKRWDLLLESLALLPAPAPPLVLCGTGALESALRTQARRLGVNVRFIGELEPSQLVGAYNAATCVVHTRPDEVFSLALIEALACGRPLLAADGGGTPELVGDAGVLAPADDPRAFAARLQALLGDQQRRAGLALAARRRAVERYSVERMVSDYADVLEGLG
jgi:glycosyltransferase involved in cell wall biosynthesis